MSIFKKRPSPAMIVAMTALCVSLVGTAFAGPIAEISNLNKKDKRTVRKISRNISGKVSNRRITKRAPGLNVATARNAAIANVANASVKATNAENAENAENSENAENAQNAENAENAQNANNANVANFATNASNAFQLSGIPSSGYARRIFARVSYDAGGTSLIASSPGVSALSEAGEGFPRLNFPQSMNNCAVVASAANSAGTQILRRSTVGSSGTTVQFAVKDEEENAVRSAFDVIASC